MVLYRYAKGTNDLIVDAHGLAGTPSPDPYFCLGCDGELVARVNGAIRTPHFAHKSHQPNCSSETYLHRLAKKIFVETYQACLANGKPYTIELQTPHFCSQCVVEWLKPCKVGSFAVAHDLTKYFTEILIESRDGAFVPDILLKNPAQPNEKIYIEICVTHSCSDSCSDSKINSGARVIEFFIEDDSTLNNVRATYLAQGGDACFYGMNYPPLNNSLL
jgi:hypothetical protein